MVDMTKPLERRNGRKPTGKRRGSDVSELSRTVIDNVYLYMGTPGRRIPHLKALHEELSDAFGDAAPSLSDIYAKMKGKWSFRLEDLAMLAEVLGTTPDELLRVHRIDLDPEALKGRLAALPASFRPRVRLADLRILSSSANRPVRGPFNASKAPRHLAAIDLREPCVVAGSVRP